MPIPKPTKDEKKKEFMGRCMGDSTMNKEYKRNSQRYAICMTSWDEHEKDKRKK